MDKSQLRFGVFMAGFHDFSENATIALERDLQLIEHMDALGFDEAWIGEHHSGGIEIIGSPEVFIAAAAQRTKHIRLGTGVVSLPYHHPLMVADRITLLDHLTRGRLMFGVGAGSLGSDAHMIGADPLTIRDRLAEGLAAVTDLLKGEVVTRETSWFTLRDARTQLPCYQLPHPEIAVASSGSPSGPRLAGQVGAGVLGLGVTSKSGMAALAATWDVWSKSAEMHGRTVDRAAWRLAGPVHIAETREQALREVRYGMCAWVSYFNQFTLLQIPGPPDIESNVDAALAAILETGMGVIGTPDDLIEKIEELWERSGGFGCWLDMLPTWADFPARLRSYELIAHYVIPHFRGTNARRRASFDWAAANKDIFVGGRKQGQAEAVKDWERSQKEAPPKKK